MCGLIGYFGQALPSPPIRAYGLSTITDRGPDFQSEWCCENNNVWIGHTRLAIRDLSDSGAQPMQRASISGITVAFNGEIYNEIEIRKFLITKGYSYEGSSDTESILYAYDYWGLDFVDKLEGMFAIAIWDERKKALHLIRDPIGQKPLFYSQSDQDNSIYFGSTPQAILAVAKHKYQINRKALGYVCCIGYVPNPLTSWKNLYSLPPGTIATIQKSQTIKLYKYWDVNNIQKTSEAWKEDDFYSLLELVSEQHCISDTDTAILLSGGMDSSAVAVSIANRGVDLNCFTLSDRTRPIDECRNALALSNEIGLNHTMFDLSTMDILSLAKNAAVASHQPQGYSSFIPWLKCSQILSERGTKVVITGDGGDELFGGYSWYDTQGFLRNILLRSLKGTLTELDKEVLRTGRKSLLHQLWIKKFPRFLPTECQTMFGIASSDFCEGTVVEYFQGNFASGLEQIDAAQRLDLKTFCVDHVCRKTDEMSMKYGLEVRSPFLDRRLVEYIFKHKVTKYNKKNLKPVINQYLRRNVSIDYDKNKKQGFSTGLEHLNISHLKTFISQSKIVRDGIFIDNRYDILNRESVYQKSRVWTVYNIALWYENQVT